MDSRTQTTFIPANPNNQIYTPNSNNYLGNPESHFTPQKNKPTKSPSPTKTEKLASMNNLIIEETDSTESFKNIIALNRPSNNINSNSNTVNLQIGKDNNKEETSQFPDMNKLTINSSLSKTPKETNHSQKKIELGMVEANSKEQELKLHKVKSNNNSSNSNISNWNIDMKKKKSHDTNTHTTITTSEADENINSMFDNISKAEYSKAKEFNKHSNISKVRNSNSTNSNVLNNNSNNSFNNPTVNREEGGIALGAVIQNKISPIQSNYNSNDKTITEKRAHRKLDSGAQESIKEPKTNKNEIHTPTLTCPDWDIISKETSSFFPKDQKESIKEKERKDQPVQANNNIGKTGTNNPIVNLNSSTKPSEQMKLKTNTMKEDNIDEFTSLNKFDTYQIFDKSLMNMIDANSQLNSFAPPEELSNNPTYFNEQAYKKYTSNLNTNNTNNDFKPSEDNHFYKIFNDNVFKAKPEQDNKEEMFSNQGAQVQPTNSAYNTGIFGSISSSNLKYFNNPRNTDTNFNSNLDMSNREQISQGLSNKPFNPNNQPIQTNPNSQGMENHPDNKRNLYHNPQPQPQPNSLSFNLNQYPQQAHPQQQNLNNYPMPNQPYPQQFNPQMQDQYNQQCSNNNIQYPNYNNINQNNNNNSNNTNLNEYFKEEEDMFDNIIDNKVNIYNISNQYNNISYINNMNYNNKINPNNSSNNLGTMMSSFLQSEANKRSNYIILSKDIVLGKQIGFGGTSEVYKGTFRGSEVAVKKLRIIDVKDDKIKEFKREVSSLSMMRHPHLVLFMGAIAENDNISIVTEYCAGGTLFKLLHDKQVIFPWELRVRILYDIAVGMNFLHTNKPPIIHRDLKSLNILLTDKVEKITDTTKIKISDFGLSKIIEKIDSASFIPMTGQLGTCHWMAPEVIENKQYSLKADVYSFGIMVWEICSRRTPYEGKNQNEIAFNVTAKKMRPDKSAIPIETPHGLRELIEFCWDADQNNRPTFEQITELLSKILSSLSSEK
eukprot:CAMPEP_0170523400 /NCGR_PEP_ID=MMETSP0209-20121228/8833_1 /TAXON_ID=665100 ORGANISM="Litonotus pictus, Strain P1" /NCGR_SAMPLE_ID=MMETSP0209 /ASSEMBLY_ACC=CAM_ASM_000301 /LENGTH=1000 /DNA_ID=CAMNT_0010811473 /DNA_START=663 /DNA_END=3665 /DNA_ORIENTATION=-